MKSTPFLAKHIALGAKMAEFAGYNMPISYSGINDEHAAVRNNAGIFDVSHMGEFILKGEHALDLAGDLLDEVARFLRAGPHHRHAEAQRPRPIPANCCQRSPVPHRETSA